MQTVPNTVDNIVGRLRERPLGGRPMMKTAENDSLVSWSYLLRGFSAAGTAEYTVTRRFAEFHFAECRIAIW